MSRNPALCVGAKTLIDLCALLKQEHLYHLSQASEVNDSNPSMPMTIPVSFLSLKLWFYEKKKSECFLVWQMDPWVCEALVETRNKKRPFCWKVTGKVSNTR